MRTRRLSAFLLVAALVGAAPPVSTTAHRWRWPANPHVVVREYVAPASAYAPGHRGIDLAVHGGQPVYAPAGGIVSYAGTVADRPLVSVRLPGDLVVTLEPVRAVAHVGDVVRAGDLLGTVDTGGHCRQSCLHLGARLHGGYVSPRLYLDGVPRAILLPLAGPAVSDQARGWAVR